MPKRIYYPYQEREECAPNGMWRNVSQKDREAYAALTAELMRNPDTFRNAMLRVLDEWPRSAEAALTATGVNHQAWMGHAGCFLATQSPEDATRLGWHQLDYVEQTRANGAADRAIAEWKRRRKLHIMGGQTALFENA